MLKPDDDITIPKDASLSRVNSAQWMIAAFLLTALILGALFYWLVRGMGFGHTSLMFVGIPVVLAIILVLAPTPRSATGSILRGMTLALLIVAPLVGEGYLCILLASPLFLAVGLVVGVLVDSSRANRSTTLSCIAIVFLPLSLEGIVPQLTHNRTQSVEATQMVNASAAQIEAALAQSPNIATGAAPLSTRGLSASAGGPRLRSRSRQSADDSLLRG